MPLLVLVSTFQYYLLYNYGRYHNWWLLSTYSHHGTSTSTNWFLLNWDGYTPYTAYVIPFGVDVKRLNTIFGDSQTGGPQNNAHEMTKAHLSMPTTIIIKKWKSLDPCFACLCLINRFLSSAYQLYQWYKTIRWCTSLTRVLS